MDVVNVEGIPGKYAGDIISAIVEPLGEVLKVIVYCVLAG